MDGYMRVSYFLICSLFAFLSSYPSFALDEDESDTAEGILLLSLSKDPEVQRLKKGRQAPHKEMRAKVKKAVDEIMSTGRAKETVKIIEVLQNEVVGLEEHLQKDLSREQLRRWIYRAQGRYYGRYKKNKIQKITKAPSAYQTAPTQTNTRSSFSTATQAMDHLELGNKLPSPSELFPDIVHSMPLPSIKNFPSSANILPSI